MGLHRTTLIRLCFILGVLATCGYILTEIASVISARTLVAYTEGGRQRNFPCEDRRQASYLGQRGKYWVLYNYVTSSKTFACDESITFTTPGDMTFLDKLVPLLERWQGPVSVALYSPGPDFNATLDRINYLRECSSPLVKAYATFHLFFDQENIPNKSINHFLKEVPVAPLPPVDCGKALEFGEDMPSFRKKSKLLYPINVARNVAKEMATTHYILAADIELFPSPNFIPKFIRMITRNDRFLRRAAPKVFVLPHFEVEANVTKLPENKRELQELLKKDIAVPFHKFSCSVCHSIPKHSEWAKEEMGSEINVFHVGKRLKAQKYWEPFYIGTKLEPMWDERLTWEGRANKMTQNYIMCLLDYEYLVLDNAFLVHSPGIKRTAIVPNKTPVVKAQYSVIKKTIVPEINKMYGTRNDCKVLA